MNKTSLQRAYVLHQRPFSETSTILDCFTEQAGRISIIAKGVRKRRKTQVQSFCEYWLQFGGKAELKQLYSIDIMSQQLPLTGMALSCGFYVNELLLKLIEKEEPASKLWDCYHQTIVALSKKTNLSLALREFELNLTAELGYGFHLDETRNGDPLQPSQQYVFEFSYGIEPFVGQAVTSSMQLFTGQQLLAIQARAWHEADTLYAAKRLLRQVIDELLDGKPLQSREYAKNLIAAKTQK